MHGVLHGWCRWTRLEIKSTCNMIVDYKCGVIQKSVLTLWSINLQLLGSYFWVCLFWTCYLRKLYVQNWLNYLCITCLPYILNFSLWLTNPSPICTPVYIPKNIFKSMLKMWLSIDSFIFTKLTLFWFSLLLKAFLLLFIFHCWIFCVGHWGFFA